MTYFIFRAKDVFPVSDLSEAKVRPKRHTNEMQANVRIIFQLRRETLLLQHMSLPPMHAAEVEMSPFKCRAGLDEVKIGEYIQCNKIQWIRGQRRILSALASRVYIVSIFMDQ